ncbi:MAG TPA: Type 1 glutamine amidotransferase-like domain-containing protein [Chloroflexota bacterium]|nr:Type 1 glutamine amidotransferase-like domain-containing protein [Chloroflexota bacterium]
MLALAGGNEFRELSRGPDSVLLTLAGGPGARVAIVPAAAVDNPRLAAANGVRHFSALGARAEPVMVVDRATAMDAELAGRLQAAGLVYLTGGNPWHLIETLRDTPAHEALRQVHLRGKVVAGSSAGAMALAAYAQARRPAEGWRPGLGLAPGLAVIPHADEWGLDLRVLAERRAGLPEAVALVAIDTQTVLVEGDASWRNLGPGRVLVALPRGQTAQLGPDGELLLEP